MNNTPDIITSIINTHTISSRFTIGDGDYIINNGKVYLVHAYTGSVPVWLKPPLKNYQPHNPDKLSDNVVEVIKGYRLLDEDEIVDRAGTITGIEAYFGDGAVDVMVMIYEIPIALSFPVSNYVRWIRDD